ncbi:DNA-3-methyladenine glycosylase family protein [Paenibacillus arenilitoris]|uniref:DNA-3-methyladenine glycosylase II n=1 Tax=Paenibacillus arenilitoris TaxID=2772299 RepID=A0A927H6K2_9BACL|nr:DNA-3-methyladenine glycosylase 2 family protein [Paenibacillus arenilitoris]MBD2868654.1 DNA-3-methyladenine glycosylase 2 family protein [Paenibacillus arenilitoris]
MATTFTRHFRYGQEEIDYLSRADPALGAAMEHMGRVERTIMPDPFAALAHAIVGQLISAKAASTVWDRLETAAGAITPRNVAGLSAENIRRCGMTMKKAASIRDIAQRAERGELSPDALRELSDKDVIDRLTAIDGVGKWTAEMLLLHALERPDVVSWGDVAIRRGMMKLYGLTELTKKQFDEYRARYSPHGSVASIYLWEISFQ